MISEMITARPLVEGHQKTLKLADFGPGEHPRSLQLYGVNPVIVAAAVERLVDEGRVDHIDLNFGCPVRKVTRKGGGAAIPAKPRLLTAIVRAAVRAAGSVPVTIKFRMGIDDEHLDYLESGRIAEGEGCAAVTLHARTAAQLYDGRARWDTIARLRDSLTSIAVIGNGDIWKAEDATRMVRETGCDGVAVGRGCLGRPWLFRDLADAFTGRPQQAPPNFGEITDIMLEHARMLVEWFGERQAMLGFRKHSGWYTRGFRSSASLRDRLMRVQALAELRAILADVDRDEPFPEHGYLARRGKRSGTQKVALPEGFWDDPDDPTPPDAGAELAISGG
jgi:nifR3 family TIM-barrel protein